MQALSDVNSESSDEIEQLGTASPQSTPVYRRPQERFQIPHFKPPPQRSRTGKRFRHLRTGSSRVFIAEADFGRVLLVNEETEQLIKCSFPDLVSDDG
jgi:hypothetical protein